MAPVLAGLVRAFAVLVRAFAVLVRAFAVAVPEAAGGLGLRDGKGEEEYIDLLVFC